MAGADAIDQGMEAVLPTRFAEALYAIRRTIGGCETADIPTDTILAAMLAELVQRLVDAYGPASVATMLKDLATHVTSEAAPTGARH